MHVHGEELALDQIRLLRLAQTDGAVRVAHVHIQLLVVEDQLDLHVRIELQEFLDLVGEPALAETDCGRHAQFAAWLVSRLGQLHFDRFELQQNVMGGTIEQLTLFSQNEAARMAVEKLDANVLLESADLPANGGLRQVQLVGRMRERTRFGSRVKDTQLIPIQWHAVSLIGCITPQPRRRACARSNSVPPQARPCSPFRLP